MKNSSLRLLFWSGLLLCLILITTCKELEKSMLVATDEAANVLTNSADLPGQIIDLGGGATQHGHYHGKSDNPSGSHTTLGAPNSITGFTSQVTGLEAGTKYLFKAYITDGQETVFGKEKSFTTLSASAPALTTTAITAITLTGAVSGGNITSDGGAAVTARGVCWNSFTAPTISNNKTTDAAGTGTFTSTLTGLTAGSTYFVRSYATNSAGITYGNELTFTTTAASIPTVTTNTVSGINYNSGIGGGNVTSDGGSPVLEKGVCWSTATGPTISNTKTTNGPGAVSFGSPIEGLSPTTKYYVRAYATNIVGTAYGSEVSFTTGAAPVQLPVLTTVSPGNVTSISATSGGNISSDGGASITSRGVCWNTTGSPSAELLHTTDGTGTGPFASAITGLTPNTKYYVRAYAVNSVGIGYGSEYNFTTLSASSAVLTTSAITSIAQTTASGGGNITSDGGASITARGVCWSLNQNPTLADSYTTNDFGTGIFNSQLTSLSPGRTYYVRAYATNSTGTTYGSQVSFLTASDIPKVSTSAVGTVTATTADVGGEVLDNNGSTTTTRGVCYNLIGSPTITDIVKSETGSIGTFTMSLTGLTPNTNYYLKAFATNGVGTAYGSQVQFTTPAAIPALTTTAVSSITTTTATSGGVISTDGGSNILIKGVCWSTSPGPVSGGTNQTTDGGGSSNYTSAITGLSPNTTYYLRAYATNGKGTAYGNELTFKTNTVASTVPGAPTGVSAAPGNAQAIVTFTVPGTDGGSAITGYTVTSSPGGVTSTGSASPVTVTGLTNGTSYTFTVTATNAIGTSIASSASNSVTPLPPSTVPGAPTGVTATAGNAQATVAFTAPVSNGGSAITGYTVTSNPGSITATGSVSPVIVTGLTNGTSYTFTVTATNINGPGPASTASNSVIPSTIPGAPNMGTATAGDAMASVTFTPPVSDGGSAITVFIVTSNPGGHQGTGVVSPVNVTGLTNGTSYTFTITATNINGAGPASTVSNSVIPSTIPGAPTIGTATAGNAQATVTFTAPVNNGGSSITGYTVTSNPGGITASGTISPIIVTGLTNGTAYTFTVIAKNVNGSGAASSASNSVTPSTVPGAPTGVSATGGNAQAAVLFTPPVSDGGSVITLYTVTSSPSGFTGNGSASPITVTGLINGTAYTFTVTATNTNGTGAASSASNSVTPLLPAPTITDFPAIIKNYDDSPFTLIQPTSNSSGAFSYVSSNTSVATISGSTVTITGAGTSTITASQASTANYASGTISSTLTVNAIKPALSTNAITAITSTSATSGGNITSNGGATVTASGVCWSTTATPVATGSHTTDGATTGTYTSSLTVLTLGQTYYIRAYATNSVGTGYGNEVIFTTALGVGDSYQGGIVAYILQTGDPGYVSGQSRGLIAAPSDQGLLLWGCGGTTLTGADGTVLGTGNQNTTDIVAECITAGIAAQICNDLILNGYSDWYLPSKDELNKLFINKTAIGSFTINYYWNSSEEASGGNAWSQSFNTGVQTTSSKAIVNYVRAVRAFPAAPALPAISTTAASAITTTTATSGGNVLADGGADITARGVCWGLASGPTISGSHTTDASGSGVFTSSITGLAPGQIYYIRAYATNSKGTGYGDEKSFTSSVIGGCGTVTDVDLNTYNTVTIGTQCWMAENLKTTKYRDGTAIPNITGSSWSTQTDGAFRWYNDDIGNKSSYGALYNYYTVVNNHNLCPVGWHVPTDDEIKTLEKFLGMSVAEADATDWRGTDQGTQLKSTAGWNSGGNGTNSSGFNAIPAGNIYNNVFGSLGNSCFLWSTIEGNSTVAYSRSLSYSTTTVYRTVYNKNQGFSVRCLQGEGLVLPAVTTDAVSAISSTTATSGGNVTSNGGAAISARGVCWNTSHNPTVDLTTKTLNGTSTGTFVSNLSALVPLTTYYVRAYATNSVGTAYGDEVSFTTTAAAGLAVGDSYQGGIVAYILQPGDPGYDAGQTKGLIAATSDQALDVAWWNGSNISTGATGVAIGSGRVNTTAIVNAQSNTGSYAAKVCNDYAGGGYSDWYLPSKDELDKLYNNRVAIGGFASYYYWGSTEHSISNNNAWIGGFDYGGSGYTLKVSTANVRAIRAFPSANTIPSITTTAASVITSTTATSGGNILTDGGASVSARGVCWSTSTGPTIFDAHTTDANGTGVFTSSLTGLTPNTTYYVRAYATSSVGTAYGNEVSLTTSLAIGDSYQGGKVAYILQVGDPGYLAGQTHGIIAALSDQSTNAEWGCFGTLISGADGSAIGTGLQNTIDIMGGCATAGIAARLCRGVTINGYSDWYLPSKNELNKLYLNKAAIGVLNDTYYWSSTEGDSSNAWFQSFLNGSQYSDIKNITNNHVRAVRAF